jgi:tetratricopeptide (TPR) repeat protein
MVIKPKDDAYRLIVAISQALGDFTKSAKYLEIMVQNNPKNSSYWLMLLNSYLSAIQSTPEDSFLRNQAYAMGVYTINRAQQNGFMQTPQDYYNKVAMYINSDQLEGAADLLESSLRSGKMESAKYSNWELLANTYIQLDEIQKAIDTFRTAQKISDFTNDGNIDMQIGNLYFSMQQYRPALDAMLAASRKEVPPKKAPGLYSFMAYVYLYLKEYDQGMVAVQKSLDLSPNDQSAQGIKRALQEAIEERNQILNRGQQPEAAPQPVQEQQAQAQAQQQTQTAI